MMHRLVLLNKNLTMAPLRLSDFDYELPSNLIAQEPVRPRDHSRLMVVNRNDQSIKHKSFFDVIDYLNPGDVLVINNSKVIPARLHGNKPTGGKTEVFLLNKKTHVQWECMTKGKNMEPGMIISFPDDFSGILKEHVTEKTWLIEFNKPGITSIGETPLPPYITARSDLNDYQTVYAEHDGSVAAPTAGLHFTPELLFKLQEKGIVVTDVTLHVGLGTFSPVTHDDIDQHEMHAEYGELPEYTQEIIEKAKQDGFKVIAVGTTSARTLEAFEGKADRDWIDVFIRPGYTFNTVDGMITNFHLPKSTLLMLISALADKTLIDKAYETAIAEKYRFYSFGDAMLIV